MKKLKIVFLFLFFIALALFLKTRPPSADNPLSRYPKCPNNLAGILTSPLIDLTSITSITPLGNLNPPGHTSPVDHNYFSSDSDEPVPVYAPADGWVTDVVTILAKDEKTGKYVDRWITIDIEICQGLKLTFANLTEASDILKDNWPKNNNGCKYDIKKEGHDFTEGQCYFHTNIKVKAGDLLGYTQNEINKDGTKAFPFEIWAANYNQSSPSNIDWSFYDDARYAHIMCTFDLYAGTLKQQFYAKLGGIDLKSNSKSTFIPRTSEPICGTVNQNIVGTIQGMWFGQGWKNREDKTMPDDSRQFSFLHWNVDPAYAEIGNAGEITGGRADQVQFIPNHTGTIDREPSEVTADGKVYCYNFRNGKILTELVDDRHLKLEYQSGLCQPGENFTKPYNYER
ncbi:MAG: hypothetical protein WC243_00440 [Patescibacteria group bacterium]|jgi:hypothetical protein